MPNLTARDMLARLPVRMAEGGEARAFSDDEVKQFIQSTYAQFGGPGVEAHKAIADAMAQYGVGVNQVARATGYTPREVEAEFMGQRAGERPVLDDPTGTAAGMSAAYRAAAQAGGQQTVDDYYANLRADAASYLANPNAPTGVDAYNQLIQSGISTSDLRAAGVADEVLNKIFTVDAPIAQSQFTTPTGMTSAYERSPDLAFESQRLTALGQDGRGILDKQGRDYIANLQQDGIDAAERAQMLEYATERGYSFDDLLKAGVDPNVLFTQRAPVGGGAVDDGSAAEAAEKAAADAAAKAAADKAAADAAAKAAADKAAADAAAEQKRLMDIRIAEEAERVRQAAAKAAADKAAADAAAKAAADAAVVAPGVTTGDMVKAVTPTGPTAAELQAAIDAANAAAAKTAADAKATREAQEAAERARIAGLTKDAVAAVTPSYNAQQLQNIIKAAESQPAAEGTVTNPVDTRGSAATGSQSGVSKFLETYTPAAPFVAPAYTAPTVYQPIAPQPDMFAAGQPALDTAFRESSPRTAIPGMPGQFDYSPAAKLRSATGSGFTFTPPSITTRPRSLLSPREIQAYGGTMSASQRFAQNRSLIDRNLRDILSATPALRDNASTYNLLRNRVMAGEFGADPARVFNPETAEGQRFQAFLASLSGAAPTTGATTGAATGTVADAVIDGDATDRQIAASGGTTSGSTVAGGYAAPIDASPLAYGGYRLEPFSKGGEATSSRRMLESLTGKKSEGQRVDATGLQRFAEGGEARVGGSAPAVAGRTGRAAQLAAQREEDPQTESRTMLERLGRFASLDTPPEMGLGETVADIGMGFLPVVGTAQGARDFERARRDEDNLGMLLSAASMIPVAGGVIKLGKTGASAARKAVDELSEIFAENPLNPREMVTSGAGATVYPMGSTLRLSDIRTFDPGKGNASQMLRSILEVADKNKVPVELTAQNYSGKGLTTPQLVDWYKRRGFEVVEDLGEDGVDMIRQPRGVTGELPSAARQGLEGSTPAPAVPTETPEFKNFFGKSKVVNDAGRPLQVFHGTNVDFDQFATDISSGRKRFIPGELGTWFGSTPEVANSFARGVITPRERGVVYPVYLNIQNPKVYDSYEDFLSKMQGRRSASTVKKELQKQGFDGIQIKNSTTDFGGLRDDWVAFKPTQIKSAVGNVGTFDPSTPVITKAKGGLATKSNVERVRNDNRRYL